MALNSQQVQTVSNLLQALSTKGIPWENAKLLVAQGMWESANYTSRLFALENNTSGMKMPSSRKIKYPHRAATVVRPPASEGTTPYVHYDKPEDCICDVADLMLYRNINWSNTNTINSFVDFIASKGYFGYNPTQAAVATYRSGLNNKLPQLSEFIEPVLLSSKKKLKAKLPIIIFALAVLVVIFTKK